mmetsp:Transcript_39751/g.158161  ORF Transcript_39751/g.158161 Transcript_39751/m.158161 type:complete len:144 (+) Transcript_39751:1302-1733(+)
MEWVEGTKAPWGEDALRIIDVGIQCTLRQLLDGGYFHADPHPGNLIRTVDGRLAYIDFGMMSEVQPQKRYDLISSIMHLINQDYNGLAVDLVNLEFLPVDADVEAIAPVCLPCKYFNEYTWTGIMALGDMNVDVLVGQKRGTS